MKKFSIIGLVVIFFSVFSFGQTPNITSSQINYWVGSGTNEVIVAMLFPEDENNAFAWGYRWSSGTVTLEQVLIDLENADPRLTLDGVPGSFMSAAYYDDPTNGRNNYGNQCGIGWINNYGAIQGTYLSNGAIVGWTCADLWDADWNIVNVIPVDDPNPSAVSHTITASSNSFGTISPSGDSAVVEGESILYHFTPNQNCFLDSLILDEILPIKNRVSNNTLLLENIENDHTLRAVFKQKASYTVHASCNAYGTITPNGDSAVFEGDEILYIFTPDEGYHLDSLILDETEDIKDRVSIASTFLLENIQSNHSLRAVYIESNPANTYTIYAKNGYYGTISPSGDSTVLEGAHVVYSFTPNEGYHLKSVLLNNTEIVDLVSNNTYTLANITSNDTISALFAVNKNNTITTDDIIYWVGEGENKVIFAVNWCEPEIAFAWGYRFNEEKVLVSTVMDSIKKADYRFDYTDGGGFVTEITYKDSTYDLALSGAYWMYNVNEGFADGVNLQYVSHNDVIEFGDEACGLSDDFWNYVWTTSITPVSIPVTSSIVSAQQEAINVSIYPNPANDYANLTINGIEGNVVIKIIDVNGKLIYTEQFPVKNNTTKQIQTNSFAKGVYFVRLQNDNSAQIQKLIVQ